MVGAMKRLRRDQIRPRNWSNVELAAVAREFSGAVINVSGWLDEDKIGKHYRDYFTQASEYCISNFCGEHGATGRPEEIFIDLEGDIPDALRRRFQVAFNHTVLEHVYDIHRAVANICALSDDTVILVTPFLQQVHYADGSYGDYWRPTPMCLEKMLAENGFQVVYQAANDNPWHIVYVLTIAMRDPRAHASIPRRRLTEKVGETHFVN